MNRDLSLIILKIGVIMSIFSIDTLYRFSEHALSLCYIWSVAVIGSYGLISWGFNVSISFEKIIKWLSIIIGVFGLSLIGLSFFPENWQIIFTNLIVPRLICAFSLHLFLLSLDRFIKHRRSGKGMIPTRLVVAIIMVYIISTLEVLAVLGMSNEFALKIAAFNSIYIMRGSLLGSLFLEIYGGRCREHNQSDALCSLHNSSENLTNQSDSSISNSSTNSYFDRFN